MAEQVTEEQRAALSQQRGKDARFIVDPEKRREFIAEQGKQEAKGKDFQDIQKQTESFETGLALRGSFKKGGVVPETGNYKLHKGEKVIPMADEKEREASHSLEFGGKKKAAPKKSEKKADGEKKTVHSIHIHKVHGGHLVHHFHQPWEPGMKPDAAHVVPEGPGGEGDIDNLHNHLEEHMGGPNAGEEALAPGVVPGGAGPGIGAGTPPMGV
jgi:hypothetical protein